MPTRPLTRRQIYRRRRIAVFGGLGLALATLLYLPMTLLAPLRPAEAVVAAPVEPTPEVPALMVPGYGGSAVGALGYPGVLAQGGSTDPLPMASITKVITALVVLEAHPLAPDDPGPTLTMTSADAALYAQYRAQNANVVPMSAGMQLTQRQLMEVSLIESASNYTMSLVRWAFGSDDAFVAAARAWLDAHDLSGIVVNEPTGLDRANRATAAELVELARIALQDPVLVSIVSSPAVEVPGVGSYPNRNELLGIDGIDGIKTGTLDDFGANLLFSADYAIGAHLVTVVGVVLGGVDHDTINRDIRALLETVRANFTEVEVAAHGEAFATYTTAWGASTQAVAGDRVTLLTWAGAPVLTDVVAESVRTGEAGDDVGEVTFTSGPATVTVELELETDLADPGPWWRLTNPVALF